LSIRSLGCVSVFILMVILLVPCAMPGAHARAETSLTIFDNNFAVPTGATKGPLIAKLTSNGNPVEGENITWAVTVGKIGPRFTYTDDNGEVFVYYTAPSYETTVYVTASYAGSEQYMPSSAIAYGTITSSTPITPLGPSSPSTGFPLRDVVVIAIAIICVIVVPLVLSGKI
jgi:hypothetical protein